MSLGTSNNLAPDTAPLLVSIYPERDRSCHFMVHEQSDEGLLCKMPLGYEEGKQLDKMVTLKNFVEGAWEVLDAKIMICVKSIGARKKRGKGCLFTSIVVLTHKHSEQQERRILRTGQRSVCRDLDAIWN